MDEKWSFVAKKEKNCDEDDPEDQFRGDCWDHVAFDPEHRLVVSVIPGERTSESAEELVADVKERLGDRTPGLITTDEYAPYEGAILEAFGTEVVPPRTGKPGRPSSPTRGYQPHPCRNVGFRRLGAATSRSAGPFDRIGAECLDRANANAEQAPERAREYPHALFRRLDSTFTSRQQCLNAPTRCFFVEVIASTANSVVWTGVHITYRYVARVVRQVVQHLVGMDSRDQFRRRNHHPRPQPRGVKYRD